MPQVTCSTYLAALFFAAALLTSCSVGQQSLGSTSYYDSSATSSRTKPDAAMEIPKTLTYIVTGGRNASINFYKFPNAKTPVGSINAIARGLCSDKAGDIWTAQASSMVEYEHGKPSPIAQLPAGPGTPWACSVDPRTGDLAACSFAVSEQNNASVAIYHKATGSPKIYTDANIKDYYACAYDGSGNLLVEGPQSGSGGNTVFAELQRGAKNLEDVSLQSLKGAQGSIQWDGSYFVISQEFTLYRVAIAHGSGSVVSQTTLDGILEGNIMQFSIHGSKVIAIRGNEGYYEIAVYPYPSGSPRTHHHFLEFTPLGLTVSFSK